MPKTKLLFVDNDPDFLKTRAEFLTEEGYEVVPAGSVQDALKEISQRHVDLAVIDVRLVNDDDEKDESGLKLARESDPALRKIILTNFPTYGMVRQALKNEDGVPPAVDFVDKKEGPMALLKAIR